MKYSTKKITTLALSVSLALIFSFIEFTLYKLGIKEAIAVSLVRVFLVSILFGSPVSLIYSISGATLSLLTMILLKKLTPLSEISISVSGAVMHNVGQIIAASFMLATNVVVYYLPFLILSGVLAGIAVGVVSALLIKKVKISFK